MREVFIPQGDSQLPGDPQSTPRWKWREQVAYSFPRRVMEAVTQGAMTPGAVVLLLGLMGHLGWDNSVTHSLATVVRRMGLDVRTGSRALAVLERARLVHVDRRTPTLLRLTVSPYLVWKGRPHKVYEARKAFDERCRLSEHQQADSAQHEQDNAALAAAASLPAPD